ncbi:hypothetical protein GOBAR_AA13423 [Gossypium barbadense]|uniref:Uncharacterized protein n=1 Tax=Gossypium barbadense TaxID=3634 RepID=A0A2P5XV46_GOSBA|nr:hypothetical protein GOBAR_AA13423 [Gossypium barbadense]
MIWHLTVWGIKLLNFAFNFDVDKECQISPGQLAGFSWWDLRARKNLTGEDSVTANKKQKVVEKSVSIEGTSDDDIRESLREACRKKGKDHATPVAKNTMQLAAPLVIARGVPQGPLFRGLSFGSIRIAQFKALGGSLKIRSSTSEPGEYPFSLSEVIRHWEEYIPKEVNESVYPSHSSACGEQAMSGSHEMYKELEERNRILEGAIVSWAKREKKMQEEKSILERKTKDMETSDKEDVDALEKRHDDEIGSLQEK